MEIEVLEPVFMAETVEKGLVREDIF